MLEAFFALFCIFLPMAIFTYANINDMLNSKLEE